LTAKRGKMLDFLLAGILFLDKGCIIEEKEEE